MLTAKKQLQQTKTESDKNYLERKCATLDKQIDELVYQLYGLTEEEIKIEGLKLYSFQKATSKNHKHSKKF